MLLLPCEHPQHSVDARPQTHCYHSASRCLCHVNTPFFFTSGDVYRRQTLAWKQSTFVQKTCGALLLYEKKKKEKRIQCVSALGSRRCRNEAVLPSGVNKVDLIWYHPPVSSCLISPGHIDTREGKQSFRCSREIKTKLFFCLATWQQIDFLFFSFF